MNCQTVFVTLSVNWYGKYFFQFIDSELDYVRRCPITFCNYISVNQKQLVVFSA